MTDSLGAAVETLDYFPFGGIRIDNKASGSTASLEQRKYIGQEYDADTGLAYLNARYYNATLAKFVSEDPVFLNPQGQDKVVFAEFITNPQSQNSYAYANNNPIVKSDPSGKVGESIIGEVAGGVLGKVLAKAVPILNVATIAYDIFRPTALTDDSKFLASNQNKDSKTNTSYQPSIGAVGMIESSPNVNPGLKLGQNIGKLGQVVENVPGEIKGFTIHGNEQMLSRGLTEEFLEKVVSNPLITLSQDSIKFAGEKNYVYLTREGGVVLNHIGEVITTYGANLFKRDALDAIKLLR